MFNISFNACLEIFKAWNFGGLIFGPEVFLGFVGSPEGFFGVLIFSIILSSL